MLPDRAGWAKAAGTAISRQEPSGAPVLAAGTLPVPARAWSARRTHHGGLMSRSTESIARTLEAGTPFQRRVWQALLQIPAGTTRTYSQIAQAIGMPRAARAVARAGASN